MACEVELCIKSLSDEKVRKVLSAHISGCPLCSFFFVMLMRHSLHSVDGAIKRLKEEKRR